MFYFKSLLFVFSSFFFIGCSSTQSQNSSSPFHFFSNTTGISYAGNKMRVKKLTPFQHRIKTYEQAKYNK